MHEELVKLLLRQQSQLPTYYTGADTSFLPVPWKLVSVRAPVNIALVKYWGKDDEDLIVPSNSSISITLSSSEKDALFTETTVIAIAGDGKANGDSLELNGNVIKLDDADEENSKRYQRVLSLFRDDYKNRAKIANFTPIRWTLKIISDNNFPTAAGLASSASGFAALTFALKYIFDVPESSDASCIARQGSGSACRSMQGGFVLWSREASLQTDVKSSCIQQLFDEKYWPELCCVVCVLKGDRKATGSTSGMRRAHTSPLFAERLVTVRGARLMLLESAIRRRDFASFGSIVMEESDELHQICATSVPPLSYLNDASNAIINLVLNFNSEIWGGMRVTYTFDAGPNAFLFFERKHAKDFMQCFYKHCRVTNTRQLPDDLKACPVTQDEKSVEKPEERISVESLIFCKVGSGPRLTCYCNCTGNV